MSNALKALYLKCVIIVRGVVIGVIRFQQKEMLYQQSDGSKMRGCCESLLKPLGIPPEF